MTDCLEKVFSRSLTVSGLPKNIMKRYYSPSLDRGLLDAEQSHHCAQVMRQAVGDLFAVFDGHGVEAKARITEIARDQVRFQILAKAASPRPALMLMSGPGGDSPPAEIGQARSAGFIPVSLGKIILRAETAAFFALSAIAYELME